MLASIAPTIDTVDSPPLAPSDLPVDRAHLYRMTLGDRTLEREVLSLFDRQIELLIARMDPSVPARVAGLAHTLNGSAVGIGAWRVAGAAEALERAVREGSALEPRLADLRHAAREVQASIGLLLHQG